MAFLESRIDPLITRGALRKVTQPGRKKTYVSGKLEQDFNNTLPTHTYEVSHGIREAMVRGGLTPERSYFKVLDLFYVVMFTPYQGFRFKDWADYQGVKDNTALSLISGAIYQLQRKHTFGGVDFYRPIYKPVDGTVTVYDASDAQVTGTVDPTTGQFTADSGTPSYWVGEFDIPVTFAQDEWSAELQVATQNLHVLNGTIPLEEIRL
jgi:uncharacterized protein (TIGR02217 family)